MKLRQLIIALFVSFGSMWAAADSPEWVITGTDTVNYFPPTFGNGLTGGVIDRSGVAPSRLFQATSFREGISGEVSSIQPTTLPLNLLITVDRENSCDRWSQSLDMHRGEITTHYNIGPVEVDTRFCALRRLPHALLAQIELKAESEATVVVTNRAVFPETLTDTIRIGKTIWCEDGGVKISTTRADHSAGRHLIATSVILTAGEGNWQKESADTMSVTLQKGQTASMWAIATICSDADFADPTSEADRQAIFAYRRGAERLLADHRADWQKLWEGDIQIHSEPGCDLPLQIRSALYNLYSSLREGSRLSIAPMGLTSDKYYGHVFWDADTWIFPALLVLQPRLARPMIDYRVDGLPAARHRAAAYGYRGAMYPWESDHRGEESTPTFALTGPLEHHITADVARAAWLYFCATADTAWLRTDGYPLLRDCADFWVSRVETDGDGRASIRGVVGADEYSIDVDNNAFTNGSARRALEAADAAAKTLGIVPDRRWLSTAKSIPLETMPENPDIIRLHSTYTGQATKQADVELLAFPLEILTDPDQIAANIGYYAPRIDSIGGPAMSHSAMAVNYARMNRQAEAARLIDRSFRPYLRGEFLQLAETPANDETYFMTAAGGLLQAILFGYAGYDITDKGIEAKPISISPSLTGINSIIVKRAKP